MNQGNPFRPAYLRLAVRGAALLAFVLLFVAPVSFAQHGGGPPGGGGPGGPGGPGSGSFGRQPNGFPGGPNSGNMPPPGASDAPSSTMRGGLQLGPPGRWWNDEKFAKSLGLDRNQQHRMDDIFKENKGQLVTLFKGLQHEESQLEKLSRARTPDEAQIDAQIDKVVLARGELEKANAHMLLEIRKQMTPEQTERLDEHLGPPHNDN